MTALSAPTEQRFVLYNVSWQFYETMLRELEDRHIFLTYDRGALELMSPSRAHERVSRFIGRLIETMTEELGIEISSGGSTTFRREEAERGLEPDECYWIANEPAVRDKDEIDLNVDPPPDLSIEVDMKRSALNRQGIYRSLGMPEVWTWHDEQLVVFIRQPDGEYKQSDRSASFPFLPLEEFAQFVRRRGEGGESSLIREFREWVRVNLAAWHRARD